MQVLALDLATNCGWSFWKPGLDQPRRGPIKLPGGVGDELERVFLALRRWLRDFDTMEPLQGGFVVIEAPMHNPKRDDLRKMRLLLGLANEASTTALELGASPRDTKHSDMMGWWVGSKSLPSEDGKAYSLKAAKVHGWETRDDNIADSLGVLTHFIGINQIKVPWDCRACPSPEFLDMHLKGIVRAA